MKKIFMRLRDLKKKWDYLNELARLDARRRKYEIEKLKCQIQVLKAYHELQKIEWEEVK